MKSFKKFLKEAAPTNSANADGQPTGNPATTAGYGANASSPVAGFDKYFFSNVNDDLLSQGYQTPAEPGLNKWRFSNVYPVQRLTMANIDAMVKASNEYSDLMYKNTEDVMRKNFSRFMGGR